MVLFSLGNQRSEYQTLITSPRVLQFHENKTEIPTDKEKSFHIYIFSIALKERLQ